MKERYRREHDALGEKMVPWDAYYGIQTLRAVENFPVSGLRFHPSFYRATLLIKKAAALAHMDTGRLSREIGQAIAQATDEALAGRLDAHFVVDVFQSGAGVSHHMNINEVLANRACELQGGQRGQYHLVHPNDHVNMGQSSNDVVPSAIRLAALTLIRPLETALKELASLFQERAERYQLTVKPGRTHLQDAVPLRFGQVFQAYANTVEDGSQRLSQASQVLRRLNMGATAIGTGLNAEPQYVERVIHHLKALTELPLEAAPDKVQITRSMADFVHVSGQLRELAVELGKIADDMRLLSSGPRTGLGELLLPAMQPGSSIMPGKVNPVMAEMLNMVCFQVQGNDLTLGLAAQAGDLDLNVMTPLIAHTLLQSLHILTNGVRAFAQRCVAGLEVSEERCRELVEQSTALATALSPYIGYEEATRIAQEAIRTGRTVREIVAEKKLVTAETLEKILSPLAMTGWSPTK